MSISGTGVARAPRKNVIFKPVEELAKKVVSQPYTPDGPLKMQKDMTDNADEFERGYQSGFNHAIELANQELAMRRRLVRASPGENLPCVPPEVLDIQDRCVR